jgi:hypothetical protein
VMWHHGSGWSKSREDEDNVHHEISTTKITEMVHDKQATAAQSPVTAQLRRVNRRRSDDLGFQP